MFIMGAITAIAFLLLLLSLWLMVPTAKQPKPGWFGPLVVGTVALALMASAWSGFGLGEPCQPAKLNVGAIYVVVGSAEVKGKDFLILADGEDNPVFCQSDERPSDNSSLVKVEKVGYRTVLRAYFPPSPVTPKKLANGK